MSTIPKSLQISICISQQDYEAIIALASNSGWTFERAVSSILRAWALEYRLSLKGQPK